MNNEKAAQKKARKRQEAEERNAKTPDHLRKKTREKNFKGK